MSRGCRKRAVTCQECNSDLGTIDDPLDGFFMAWRHRRTSVGVPPRRSGPPGSTAPAIDYAPAHHITRARDPGGGDRTSTRDLPSGVARVAPSRFLRRHLGGRAIARGARPHRRRPGRAHRVRRVAGRAVRRECRLPPHPLVPGRTASHAARRSRHHLPGHRRHLHGGGRAHGARVGPGPRAVSGVVRGSHRHHGPTGVAGRSQVGHRRALHRGGVVGAGHHPPAAARARRYRVRPHPGRRGLLHHRGGRATP